jgi:Prealbumin-like fold domain
MHDWGRDAFFFAAPKRSRSLGRWIGATWTAVLAVFAFAVRATHRWSVEVVDRVRWSHDVIRRASRTIAEAVVRLPREGVVSMKERIERLKRIGPRTRRAVFVTVAAIAAFVLVLPAFAGPVGINAGFEDDDGNLVDNTGTGINAGIDWNTFAATTVWSGTAPLRTASATASGWTMTGKEDREATTSDSGFAGGTKQDDNCASVITAKAPNKDDLSRVYLATKTVPVSGVDHVFLMLAWVRIPQNTTSPSAHIGFEFNKGTTPCSGGSGLVQRTAGDMLIVYDFEGSSTDNPTLTLRRWVTSGSCEIGSNSPPCWGPAANLTAAGTAEARVNTTATALDEVAAPDETLGLNEFGEAGIDLTAAGVFSVGQCESFGNAFAVSRSSGNSGTAQMKDLVGPVPFQLQNCGSVTIIKQTDPRGLNQAFNFTSTLAGSQLACTGDTTPAAFSLNDTGNAGKTLGSTAPAQNSTGNTESCTNVPIGQYTVTEGADPSGFAFDSLTCTNSGGNTTSTSGRVATINVVGGGSTTCLYINEQQLGAIKITKSSTKSDNPLAGATFTITKNGTGITGSPFTTNASGEICVDNLTFGNYVVTETAAPAGYVIDNPNGVTVTVDNSAACSDATYVGESQSFTNTPTADIQVRFRDGGSGETALENPLSCSTSTGTDSTTDTTGWDDTLTRTGIKVDGSAVITITCTIEIDP